MRGLPLGHRVGGLLVIPLGLAPGLCLGISDFPISPLWVPPVDGLLNTGLVVGFDAIAGTCSGFHFAFAVGCGATWVPCRKGRGLFVGHTGQPVSCQGFRAGGRSIPGCGGHSACSLAASTLLWRLALPSVLSTARRFEPSAGPSRAAAATWHAPVATPAASTFSWRLA